MQTKIPPKAPKPVIDNVTHKSLQINWSESLERLYEVFDKKKDGKILTEIESQQDKQSDWQAAYQGYDCKVTLDDLKSDMPYVYRLRFINNHGAGAWSDETSVTTLKTPQTGEDIHRAIRKESTNSLISVLEKGEANIEAQDNMGFSPLMVCAQKGYVKMMQHILDYGAVVDAADEMGKTALMLAAFKGHMDCIKMLIDSGADINLSDKNGLTPLHYAVDGEQQNVIKQLIELQASVDAVDRELGWSPLIRCGMFYQSCLHGNFCCVYRFIILAGLRNNGNVNVARELIRCGADIELQDKDGKTALHNAILNNHSKLINTLLLDGASLKTKTKVLSLLASRGLNRFSIESSMFYYQKYGLRIHSDLCRT
ncbi:hypothetical protein Ciccas_001854 [Cichlidogyrus casuarinus]|uniref:Fibronectin type-III domain-containing protein n=1 Tax=Cichlidogyrus casuarinus TaxID=1844966 RepID=A0ABD2QJ06_9PLAT